jgi:hypothetical protein
MKDSTSESAEVEVQIAVLTANHSLVPPNQDQTGLKHLLASNDLLPSGIILTIRSTFRPPNFRTVKSRTSSPI